MTLEGQKKKHSTGGRVIRNSDRVLKEVEIILIFFYFFYSSHSINPLLTISIAAWEWSPVCWPKPQGTYCTVPFLTLLDQACWPYLRTVNPCPTSQSHTAFDDYHTYILRSWQFIYLRMVQVDLIHTLQYHHSGFWWLTDEFIEEVHMGDMDRLVEDGHFRNVSPSF